MALADIALAATAIIIALELAQVADALLAQTVVPVLIALALAVSVIVLEQILAVAALHVQIVMLMINVIMNITGTITAAEQAAHILLGWILIVLVLLLMLLL